MEMASLIIGILAFGGIFAGLAGTIIPLLPGTPLIFVSALVLAAINNFDRISVRSVVILGVLALVSFAVNFILVARGVKKASSGQGGMMGAGLGALLGFVVANIPGLFLGILVGFVAGELLSGTLPRRLPDLTVKVLGSFLAGLAFQVLSAVAMVAIVLIDYFVN